MAYSHVEKLTERAWTLLTPSAARVLDRECVRSGRSRCQVLRAALLQYLEPVKP